MAFCMEYIPVSLFFLYFLYWYLCISSTTANIVKLLCVGSEPQQEAWSQINVSLKLSGLFKLLSLF